MSMDTLNRLHEREKEVKRLTKAAIWGLLCFCGGWASRDLEQFHHTYVLNDIQVIEKHDAQRFTFAFGDNHQPFTTTFCSSYIPQFDAGMTLRVLVYEDRGACWDISNRKLGYIIARDENGKVITTTTRGD